jgi:uncharacterized protein YxeA
MTLKMSTDAEKQQTDSPTISVVVAAAPSAAPDSAKEVKGKTGRTRRLVIVGVIVVFLAALILTGSLVGYKISTDQTNNVIKHAFDLKTAEHTDVKENVEAHLAENTTVYQTKAGDSVITIVSDFNKEMQVTKVQRSGDETVCYISPLNVTESVLPQQLINFVKPDTVGEMATSYFRVFPTAVADKSFLNSISQSHCANTPLYWITESLCHGNGANATTSVLKRKKRWFHCHWYCRIYCCWGIACGWQCHW